MRYFAAWFLSGIALLAQPKPASGPIGVSYKDLRAEQKRLIDEMVTRFNKQTGQKLDPAAAYDAAPQSVRTTFDAVTHALFTTKLTGEDGKEYGTALEAIDAIEEIAGQRPDASGDSQFRIYFFLKPHARDLLERSREFHRSPDNIVFHQGYPICYRLDGTPSIQFSMTADGKAADVDVDYLSSRFPLALINGYFAASNSDVRAGRNEQTHNGRWNGLVGWWTDQFSWGEPSAVRIERSGADLRTAPETAKGKIEHAARDFYESWLVNGVISVAASYFSDRTYGCVDKGAQARNEQTQRGMTQVYIAQRLASYNEVDPPGKALPDHITAVPAWDPGLKTIPHADSASFLLAKVDRQFADANDCAKLANPTETTYPINEEDFYVTASSLKGAKNSLDVALLWMKERGFWRIVAYEVLEQGTPSVFSRPKAASASEVAAVEVDGDPELVKAVRDFLRQWLVKRDSERALEYLLPDAFACSAEDDSAAAARPPGALRRTLLTDMERVRGAMIAPTIKNSVPVVRHEKQQNFLIVRVPDQTEGLYRCGSPLPKDEIRKRLAEPATYGNVYVIGTHIQGVTGDPGVLLAAWRRIPQGWRVFWWRVETP